MLTTIGQLLLREKLPEDIHDMTGTLDKKGVQRLFHEIATRYPDRYRELTKHLADVARDVAYTTGGYSFSLDHLRESPSARKIKDQVRAEVESLLANPAYSDTDREKAIISAVGKRSKEMEDSVYKESLAENNPLAMQIKSGSRGNPSNLRSIRGADMLYVDSAGDLVPIPVLRSYSQGLSPVEYFAGAYGARKGTVDVKFATQRAGYVSKQMNQLAHRLMVSALDNDKPHEHIRGMPVKTDDSDSEGALLAHDAGGYKRNTVLTPRILAELKNKGHDRILVRSPIVGGPEDGGVYARDVGVRERGRIAPQGDMVGLAASQALSEPISQLQLSSKHTGGVAAGPQSKEPTGFNLMNQLMNIPGSFASGASHAYVDGRVRAIEPAPQGGHYVQIGDEWHYVGANYGLKVKTGDEVEAGDVISEGIPNPSQIVEHKGIGEGRKYFVDQFYRALKDSGVTVHRRNVELLARGLINHARVTEEFGQHIPDDVVPYQALEHTYQPRPDHQMMDVGRTVNKYLEKPVLHYTIGTRLRPSMIKELQHWGVKQVPVHDRPPPFEPVMVRAVDNLSHDPDWMTKMLGSNLQKNTLSSIHRGGVSDEHGTSFVPGMARMTDFGIKGKVKDWHRTPAFPVNNE